MKSWLYPTTLERKYNIFCGNCTDKGVKPPLEVQEGVKIDFIVVLNVIIVKLTISEHMMHIVFGGPPFKAESTY